MLTAEVASTRFDATAGSASWYVPGQCVVPSRMLQMRMTVDSWLRSAMLRIRLDMFWAVSSRFPISCPTVPIP